MAFLEIISRVIVLFFLVEVTPMSDRDFGRYNCTARNNIGVRYQEFILAQAGVFTFAIILSLYQQ